MARPGREEEACHGHLPTRGDVKQRVSVLCWRAEQRLLPYPGQRWVIIIENIIN